MEKSDFVLDTKGHCFLCLGQISISSNQFKPEPDQQPSHPTTKTYSLQYVSRYFKMDMKKVFHEKGVISPDLLAKVEKAKLKAELCEECAFMTGRLSELYQHMEKIELEMAFYAKLICGKLSSDEADFLTRSIESDLTGKLEIVNALRNEAMEKCSAKLDENVAPQVKLQNKTIRQLNAEKLKIQSSKPAIDQTDDEQYYPSTLTDIKTEVDVKLDSWSSPPSSITNDAEDNEYGTLEDSYLDPDNPTALLSSAAENFGYNSGIFESTPQSSVNPKTGKHKCKLCHKEFSFLQNFRTHYKSIHLKIRYKCSLCPKVFTALPNHRRHLKKAHGGSI